MKSFQMETFFFFYEIKCLVPFISICSNALIQDSLVMINCKIL